MLKKTTIIALLILFFIPFPLKAQSPEEYLEKGNLLFNQGEYGEAIECYEKGLVTAPLNNELWLGKGLAYKKLGKYDIAIKCYDKAIEIAPKDFIVNKDAWFYKGEAFLSLEKYEEAIECYEKTLEIEPSNSLAIEGKKRAFDGLKIKENPVDISNNRGSYSKEGSIPVIILIGAAFIYLYKSYWVMIIFRKSGLSEWPAFVPILDYYCLKELGKSNFWLNLFFYSITSAILLVPRIFLQAFLNSISNETSGVYLLLLFSVYITLPAPYIWMEISYKLDRPSIYGWGMMLPLINLITLPYIATGRGAYSDNVIINWTVTEKLRGAIDLKQLKKLDIVAGVKRNKDDLIKELRRLEFTDEEVDLILSHSTEVKAKKAAL